MPNFAIGSSSSFLNLSTSQKILEKGVIIGIKGPSWANNSSVYQSVSFSISSLIVGLSAINPALIESFVEKSTLASADNGAVSLLH